MEINIIGMVIILNEDDILDVVKSIPEATAKGLDRSQIASMKVIKKEDKKLLQIELKPVE